MDIFLNNEISKKVEKNNTDINQFINELQKSLNNTKNHLYYDNELYNEIYNELALAPKYKNQLEDIINNSMIEYSYDNEFVYVSYDKRANKYYMGLYDGEITRIETSKEEIKESNLNTNSFYFPIRNGEYLVEKDYIKEKIKKLVEDKLEDIENVNNRRNDGKE